MAVRSKNKQEIVNEHQIIYRAFRKGMTVYEIAEQLDKTYYDIADILCFKFGIEIYRSNKTTEVERDYITKKFKSGATIYKIAKWTGRTCKGIGDVLIKKGLYDRRPIADETTENEAAAVDENYNKYAWNGGKENFYALYACITNRKLSCGGALVKFGLLKRGED